MQQSEEESDSGEELRWDPVLKKLVGANSKKDHEESPNANGNVGNGSTAAPASGAVGLLAQLAGFGGGGAAIGEQKVAAASNDILSISKHKYENVQIPEDAAHWNRSSQTVLRKGDSVTV